MGWKNGVAFCQRNIETALRPVEDTTNGYIDDLLIGTVRQIEHDTEAMLRQHDKDIRRTLDALNTTQLVASRPKCQFFQRGGMMWQCFEGWSEKADAREIECHSQVGVANDGDSSALFLGFLQLLLYLHPGLRDDGCKSFGQA